MSDQEKIVYEILEANKNALIDANTATNRRFSPKLLINNKQQNSKVLRTICSELERCKKFDFSVAFVTDGGIKPFLMALENLENKGIPGRILTTNYLAFSEPRALIKLSNYKNIQVRMYDSSLGKIGFHTKGYLFTHNDDTKNIVIGSSNLTANALTINNEWNLQITSMEQGSLVSEIYDDFERMWRCASPINSVIDTYTEYYKSKKETLAKSKVKPLKLAKLEPNPMQIDFLSSFNKITKEGAKRALFISSTGTGKTYASAFAVQQYKPTKLLFLAHREQILKQSKKAYDTIFNNCKNTGVLSGSSSCDINNVEFLFSTVQTMQKSEKLNQFKPKEFDFIIIDEVHRAGSKGYLKILDHFSPKFCLGMSATPERTDGFNIFELFDNNIVYELRLQDALDNNLLCPFHYYGIADISLDKQEINDKSDFNILTCNERVKHIIDRAQYFGYSGDRVKGLIFVSRKDEGKELSKKLNARGLKTEFVSGEDAQEKRLELIKRLVANKNDIYYKNKLDYLISVDIFNEGVDIPEINQILLLRPTQSPIVFVQQLGRGLRLNKNKEYLCVIDFIANYDNNFMIPIALSGDRSYDKDTIRRFVHDGKSIIPGVSTIHFDEISKEKIYRSIDNARTNTQKLLKDAYLNLKYKIGCIPNINDFEEHGTIDIKKYFDKYGSYHNFLVSNEKDYVTHLDSIQKEMLTFACSKLVKFKRSFELSIIKDIITEYEDTVIDCHKYYSSSITHNSVVRNLTNEFSNLNDSKKYKNCVFINEAGKFNIKSSDIFINKLKSEEFRNKLLEIVDYALNLNAQNYSEKYKDTDFVLNKKYSYEDVCRLLGWKKNENAQNIGGYKFNEETKTFPVFINYNKDEDAISYHDRFISQSNLIALSKHHRKADSEDAKRIYKTKPEYADNRIFLFVRKNKDDKEAKEFYFLGEINAYDEPREIEMSDTKDYAFEIKYVLDNPVRDDIYDYLVSA